MSIPKSQRAAQLVGYKQKLQVNEIPVPNFGENDVLVKTGAAGWCHTDYQVWEGVYGSPTPIVPSHEPVGIIIAIGSKVQQWEIGQRVGVLLFRHACHTCTGCSTTNDIRYCEGKDMAGLTSDGGMAEYIVGDAEGLVLLPDSLSFEQAAPLMCAGVSLTVKLTPKFLINLGQATTWVGLLETQVKAPEPIGVLGIGGLGSLAVQFAKVLGHAVVAIDKRIEGRELATEFDLKADIVVDSTQESALSRIQAFTGKGGLAAIILCTDDTKAAEWSLKTLRPNGVCIPLGVPPSGYHFDSFDLIFKSVTIKGSLVANAAQIQEMMKVVDKWKVKSHVTTISLNEVPSITDLYLDPKLKGRLVMKI